jgi:hypothetical protein
MLINQLVKNLMDGGAKSLLNIRTLDADFLHNLNVTRPKDLTGLTHVISYDWVGVPRSPFVVVVRVSQII